MCGDHLVDLATESFCHSYFEMFVLRSVWPVYLGSVECKEEELINQTRRVDLIFMGIVAVH